ncbi:type II secretion system protein, partial [Candidatus Wolfebacteria bacterium]|nr:type II secretion system protein [Candidatus Wolfebacteria bacterium]
MALRKILKLDKGFTLIEVLIAAGIFSIIGYGLYFGYANIFEAVNRDESRFDAIAVLGNEMEIVRNLNFSDVGIAGGYPAGKLLAEKTASSTNGVYLIKNTVRSVDDPYDGVLGGSPNDTAPADYKIVESEISCIVCKYNFTPFFMTATVAPKGLEGASKNGALFINVFDASGQPIIGANVNVVNNVLNPTISISDITNNDGVLQLVDIPTSTAAYKITVSKSGYSSEKTYSSSEINNATPVKSHSTVAEQQITSVSFSIDKLSSLNFTSVDQLCQPVPYVDYLLSGTKLIGSNPDILKYSASSTTG